MMGNHKKNEKPYNRRIRCSNEKTWWEKRKNGFTLAEVLIVMAIIAVLISVSIPIFTNQLEKARQAVDLSNARSAYSILQTSIMTETLPDGEEWRGEGAFYVYTSSGTFQKHSVSNPINISHVYKLKSKNANLSEFINMDWSHADSETGWKDYVIVIYYPGTIDNPVMYACPLTWLQ